MPPDKHTTPKNWPSNFPYLSTPTHSTSLTPHHLAILHAQPKDQNSTIPPNTPKGPSSQVKITPITSPTHPANTQSGLFALKDLKPGTFILQYIGEIHPSSTSPDDTHAKSNYDLSLDRENGIGIDAEKKGNEARFINDYRGVADRANAEFKEVWDGNRKERGMGVFVLGEGKSGRGKGGIRKGEEILVSYGRGFWGARKEVEGGDVEEDG